MPLRRYLFGHRLCCCKAAVLLLHHDRVCGVSHERRDLWYGCHAGQNRISVSAIARAPGVSFWPLSSRLAYPGFSEQCGQWLQQDNWRHQQAQQYPCPMCSSKLSLFSVEFPPDYGSQCQGWGLWRDCVPASLIDMSFLSLAQLEVAQNFSFFRERDFFQRERFVESLKRGESRILLSNPWNWTPPKNILKWLKKYTVGIYLCSLALSTF